MSHIKIKHNFVAPLNEGVKKVMRENDGVSPIQTEEILARAEEFEVIITTTDDRIVTGFQYSEMGKMNIIFEPNPIITFFAVAHKYVQSAIALRRELLETEMKFDDAVDLQLHKTFRFLTSSTTCTLQMFASLETMLNIEIEKCNQPLIYNDEEKTIGWILRHVAFEEKIKSILPQIHESNFHSDFGHQYEYIKKLKTLRDNTMHYKPTSDKVAAVRSFITANLKFEFEETLHAVKDFINYYNISLIENCNCGKD
ncbi:MAG: hypothetical protein IPO49_15475 [Bacteroidetes bacterium]|nr:hypothetical protein [Bacteroidota bacterium]MBP6403237.1 hypothetical protein [Bacteroidia bacterium]